MAVKSRSAMGLFMMALICLFSYCGYIFFETVVSVCMLYVCVKSLYGLCMYNFATDEALFRYEQNLASKAGVFTDDIFLIRIKNIFLNLLFIIYFAGISVFVEDSLMRILSSAALLMWVFSLISTVFSYFKKQISTEWTYYDSMLEALMWIQNILSGILALLRLMTV